MGNDIRKHLIKSGKVGFEAHDTSAEVNTGINGISPGLFLIILVALNVILGWSSASKKSADS